jgi:hypothetical protein
MDICPTLPPPPVMVDGRAVRCYLHGGREEAEAALAREREGAVA